MHCIKIPAAMQYRTRKGFKLRFKTWQEKRVNKIKNTTTHGT